MASFAGDPAVDDWAAEPEIERLFRDLSARHGIDPRHLPHSRELIHRAMTASLAVGDTSVKIADCPQLLREVEFLYPAGSSDVLVKGFIDVVFEHDGLAYVLDWKSDLLPDYRRAALGRHVDASYDTQAGLYALALTKMLGGEERFGGVVYCFLRGLRDEAGVDEGVWFERPTAAALRRHERSVAAEGRR